MIPLAALAIGACLAVEAPRDQIVAADLARALPEWAAVPADTPVAIAPAPGVQRILRFAELRRLGARWGVTGDPSREVCFVRPVEPVTPERMLEAMRAQLPDAHIEIVEHSRMPAPAGPLEFPVGGLHSGYWYGRVNYGAGHRFVVWARVRVTVSVKRIVASADLKPGEPIGRGQLRVESREEYPSTRAWPVLIEEVDGRIPRRPIAAGTAIQKEWLDAPRLVQRGETVKVEVINGGAKLEAEGVAEAAGALGETITVRNPDSKRSFRARVEGPGKVSVKGGL